MFKNWPIYVTFFALAIGAWAFYEVAYVASRGGEEAPLYSTRRYDPYGTAALHQLLIQLDHPVKTLESPRLDTEERGVFIQVIEVPANTSDSFFPHAKTGAFEMSTKDIADWIAQGNTVIQLTRHHTMLMKKLDVPIDYIEDIEKILHETEETEPGDRSDEDHFKVIRRIQDEQRKGLFPDEITTYHVNGNWLEAGQQMMGSVDQPLYLNSPLTFGKSTKPSKSWIPLALGFDGVVAGQVNHGKGKLIVVGCPTPALNHYINEGANLEFLLKVIGDQPVIIDEWVHGIGQAGNIIGLIKKYGLIPFLGQIMLIIFIYHWSTKGYARIDYDQPQRRRSSIEQISTLGYLYRQSLSTSAVFERVKKEIHRRLAKLFRCSEDQLHSRLENTQSKLANEAKQILDTLNQLQTQVQKKPTKRFDDPLAQLLTRTYQFTQEHQP